ncbi:MAG TPA: ABC transporter permease [Terriglobales bacterium]|nr:ABC transporter permease [Terriglobales bacterium]
MNTHSDAISNSIDVQNVSVAAVSGTRPLYWSIRRELWENRFLYIGPLAVAGIFLLGFLISMVHLPSKVRGLTALGLEYHAAVAVPYDFIAGLMMLTTILVSLFYSADALHGERSDRSILFWKSLPVSDFTAVFAKAMVPLLVVPLICFVIAVATQWIMLVISSLVLLASGLSVSALWTRISFLHMSLMLLYHLLTAHALWPFPIYCWLLLVSGWARRAVFLWAALPLVAIAALEQIAFRTWYFAMTVGRHLIGDTPAVSYTPPTVFPTNPMTHMTPLPFLSSTGLWVGLALAAAFLAAAVRLRRQHGPV